MIVDIRPEPTPTWLAVSGILSIGIGLRGLLTSEERAAEHRSSVNTGEERFLEETTRPTTAASVRWWAVASMLFGALLLALAGLLLLTGQERLT